MTEQAKTKLTEEILTLHNKINAHGCKSVPLAIKCGKRLTEIQKNLPRGKWMAWQAEHSDVMSVSTINRYKRVYNLSLVTSLEGKTLTEAFAMNRKSKKDNTDQTTNTDQTQSETKDLTPLQAVDELVKQIIDSIDRIDESERDVALGKLKALVDFYNDRMELKVAA